MKPRSYGPFPYSPIIDRPRLEWPNGAHVALWIIPNIEYFSLLKKRPGGYGAGGKIPDVVMWSERDYGNRVGVFRIMEMLDRYGIRGTVALNTNLCAEHPQIIEEGKKRKWEWMGHNESNTRRLNEAAPGEEAGIIRARSRRSRRRPASGPKGWLGSGLQETWDTLDHPGRRRRANMSATGATTTSPIMMTLDDGRTIVAMPYTQQLNDKSAIERRFVTADGFRQMICDQFDVLYREGAKSGRVMAIALHPYLIGVPHRIGALDAALEYICKHKKVWKATGAEIARHYLAQMKTARGLRRSAARNSSGEDAMTRCSRCCRLCCSALARCCAPSARASRHRHDRHRRFGLGQPSGRSISASRRASSPPRTSSSTSIFVQSSANLVQQLAAGSLDIAHVDRAGRSDPRHRQGRADRDRAARGAGAALCAAAPRPQHQEARRSSRARSSRSAARRTSPRSIVERMLAPHGVKPGEFDMVFAGATSARASALQAGAVDASDPAAAVQFPRRGRGLQRSRPDHRLRAGAAVLAARWSTRNWAAKNPDLLRRLARRAQQERGVVLRSEEPRRGRSTIMVEASKHQARGRRAKPTTSCTRASSSRRTGKSLAEQADALLAALQQLGDLPGSIDVERFVLPGVTQAERLSGMEEGAQ